MTNISPLVRRRLAAAFLTTASPAVSLGAQQTAKPVTVDTTSRNAATVTVSVPPAQPVAFTHVTVLDVTDGRLLIDQTVVIGDNRIQTVGPAGRAPVPEGARVVEARDKFLVPGFWDMHAHTEKVPGEAEIQRAEYRKAYPLYVANGVTGIREMAQRFTGGADSFRLWQREVMEGKRIGPRAVGPSADLTHNLKLETAQDARRIIDSLKAAGDAFVKYHDSNGDRDLFFTILRTARQVGLPVVGHVPRSVRVTEAVDSGMRSIEHINEHHDCSPVPIDSAEAEAQCAPIPRAYARGSTWFDPTFSVFYYYGSSEEEVENYRSFMRLMHRLGVKRFLAGSDCEPSFLKDIGLDKVCHRGFAALQEIIALCDAGLTPLEALQAATLNPALFFEATDSLGTVAPGKLADLVLLDANPLTNIRNILQIRAVVANGRYFDRATLDRMDPRGVKLAALYANGQPDIKDEPSSDEEGEGATEQ